MHPITIKLVAKRNWASDAPLWARQLSGTEPYHFTFDPDATDYDWLVVYDDLSPLTDERFSMRVEKLSCPRAQTIFVTAEPTSIKTYGKDFLAQFGMIICSQELWAMPKGAAMPKGVRILYTMPCLRWFYGAPVDWKKHPQTLRDFHTIKNNPPLEKAQSIATMCSSKSMGHTLHKKRVAFTAAVKAAIPELDVFGHGVRPLNDKAESLDSYRYHLAMENHIAPHHITEKLTDAYLGCCLPFYIGAPNAADYFPPESFIALDADKPDEAIATIKAAMATNEYEKRLGAILEARRLVLEEQNLMALVCRLVEQSETKKGNDHGVIYSRRAMQRRSLGHALRFLCERLSARFGGH